MIKHDINQNPLAEFRDSLTQLYRIAIKAQKLEENNLTLFVFSPQQINIETCFAEGYVYHHGDFHKKSIRIPEIVLNWCGRGYVKGFIDLISFDRWLIKENIQMYPPISSSGRISNKLGSYHLLEPINAEFQPYTERFNQRQKQIKYFLDNYNKVFLKPIWGNRGNHIIVIRKSQSNYLLTHYFDKQRNSFQSKSLSSFLEKIKSIVKNKIYIIQRGVSLIKYQGTSYDIRVNMVNDGDMWNFLDQCRVGASSSDLANWSQGGYFCNVSPILTSLFGEKGQKQITAKVKDYSYQIVKFLDANYPDKLTEIALDFVIDKQQQPFLIETNTRPSLALPPKAFKNIFHIEKDELADYEHFIKPHCVALADFLINKHNEKAPIWFEHLISQEKPKPISTKLLSELLETIKLHLFNKDYSRTEIPKTIQQDTQPRIIFVSVSDKQSPAYVAVGSGRGYAEAIQSAIQRLAILYNTQYQPVWIKVDLVSGVTKLTNEGKEDKLKISRGFQGFAFEQSYEIAFTPAQIISYNLIKENQYIQPDNIRHYLSDYLGLADQYKLINWDTIQTIYQFKTDSVFSDENDTNRLYRQHRLFNEISLSQSIYSASLISQYLIRTQANSGELIHTHLPKWEKISYGYDLQQQLVAVYAQLQFYKYRPSIELLSSIRYALDRLFKEDVIVSTDSNPDCLGLLIMCITSYASLCDDKFYIDKLYYLLPSLNKQLVILSKHHMILLAIDSLQQHNLIKLRHNNIKKLYRIFLQSLLTIKTAQDFTYWHMLTVYQLRMKLPNHDFPRQVFEHINQLIRTKINRQNKQSVYLDEIGFIKPSPLCVSTAEFVILLSIANKLYSRLGSIKQTNNFHSDIQQHITKAIYFILHTQIHPEVAMYLKKPENVIGAIHRDVRKFDIRLPYNSSALLALLHGYHFFTHKE